MNNSSIPGVDKRVIDPIKLLYDNKIFLAIVGGVFFIILGIFAYLRQSPYYEVKGQVRIAPVVPALLRPIEDLSITGYYHDYLRTELERLQSPNMIEALYYRENVNSKVKSLLPKEKLQREKWYLRNINVKQVPRTQLIEISFVSDSPDSMNLVVNEILEQYLIETQMDEEQKDLKRLDYLLEVKEDLTDKRVRLQSKLERIAMDLGTGTFEQAYWLKVDALSTSHKDLSRAKTMLMEAKSKFKRVQEENEALSNVDLTGLIEKRLNDDESVWNTEFWTYRQLQNMRSSIDGITPENPDRKYIDQRMQNYKEYLDSVVRDAKEKAEKIETLVRKNKMEERQIGAEYDLKEKLLTVESLEKETAELEEMAKMIAKNIVVAKSWKKELEHIAEMEFKLNDRIHELKLDAKAPDRVSIARYASETKEAAGTNLKKLILLAGIMSFGSVGLFLYMKELNDDRIKRPELIEMATGEPSSWPISTCESSVDFSKIVLDGSTHCSARAVRSLGYKLLKLKQEDSVLKICMTGVQEGCGVTEITLNVAQTISQSGYKVAIVENNPVHQSLVQFVHDDETDRQSGYEIKKDKTRDVSFIFPERVSHLNLEELTQPDMEKFDIILYDCAPILVSDVTEATAARSDVSVLIAQGDVSLYEQFRRSFKILWRQEINHFIPVLNWGRKSNT